LWVEQLAEQLCDPMFDSVDRFGELVGDDESSYLVGEMERHFEACKQRLEKPGVDADLHGPVTSAPDMCGLMEPGAETAL
jgi:hypothetical protein